MSSTGFMRGAHAWRDNVSRDRTPWTSRVGLLVISSLSLGGCFSSDPKTGGPTDSESTWQTSEFFLQPCSDDRECGGLSCYFGACTVACGADQECSDLSAYGICRGVSSETIAREICVAACDVDETCVGIEATSMCLVSGYCSGFSGRVLALGEDEPSVAEQCEPNAALVGGVFADADETTPRIDDFIDRVGEISPPSSSQYTQAEYRVLLTEPVSIAPGSYSYIFDHVLPDFERDGWPEAAHILLRYVQASGRHGLLVGFDGVGGGGMNNHYYQLAGLQRIAEALKGYSDDESWEPPVGTRRITAPLTHGVIMAPSSGWDAMIRNAVKLTLPDGTDSGAHDSGLQLHDGTAANQTSSWGSGGMHFGHSIEATARSYLLPAYGQLGLGSGRLGAPALQTQSILHFSPKVAENGLAHDDTLMLGLFGRGRNLLSYPGSQAQSHGPQNKNMVMIDGARQNKYVSDLGGRLELFAHMPGVQIARVDASHIVHGGNANGTGSTPIERYRRTLIQNTIDVERPYLVDLFEVEGGTRHDYLMRGSGVLAQQLPETNLEVGAGVHPIEESREAVFAETMMAAYGVEQSFWVELQFDDGSQLGARSHFPAQGEAGELYTSRLIEQSTASSGLDVSQYTLHREGASPLRSRFVAVHEVLDGSGASFIESVERVSLGESAIALRVNVRGGRSDTYLVSFDGRQAMAFEGVSADAVIAASSTLQGKSDLWLVGGGEVRDGSRALVSARDEIAGGIVRVNRRQDGASSDSFDTDLELPEGYALSGRVLLLEAFDGDDLVFVQGYTVDRVERACGHTRVHVRFDPGVSLSPDDVRELHHPRRQAQRARLRWVPDDTTVPRIVRLTPGRDWTERIHARQGYAIEPGGHASVVTVPEDATVLYRAGARGEMVTRGGAGVPITEDQVITWGLENASGFVAPEELSQRYFAPISASIVDAPLQPGLKAERWSGYTYNFDLDDPSSSYDFARFEPEIIDGLSAQDVNYAQVGAGSGVRVTGYISISEAGMYTFSMRADQAARFQIGGRTLLKELGMRRIPVWSADVYLEQGLHPVEVFQYSRTASHFELWWSGPGIDEGELPASVLFH